MSDQQCAFDNWEEAAQEIDKQVQKVQTKDTNNTQSKTDQQLQQQKDSIKKPEQAKQTLKQKIAIYKKMSPQQFQAKYLQSNKQSEESKKNIKLGAGKVLKNNKDFSDFAKQIADKICQGIPQDQTINQEWITTFFEQLFLFLYDGVNWQNLFEIQKKLKVVKNQRKNEQKRIQKQKMKAKKNKAEQQSLNALSKVGQKYENKKKQNQDLFDGVIMINSKQQEQQRKKKAAQKKKQQDKSEQKQENNANTQKQTRQAPPPPPADDDDDFM